MVKAKATAIQQARSSKPKQGKGYAHLVEAIGGLIDSARQRVAHTCVSATTRCTGSSSSWRVPER